MDNYEQGRFEIVAQLVIALVLLIVVPVVLTYLWVRIGG